MLDKNQSFFAGADYTFLNTSLSLPTLKPLFNTRAKRNTALVMLLVWLFALTSGVANACLLQASGSYNHGFSVAHPPAIEVMPESSAGHAGAIVNRDADSDAFKASCLKVCDDRSQSLLKQRSAFDSTDHVLAPLIAVAWTTTTSFVSAPRRANNLRSPAPGLPIRVRFSRLAL
ncbi:MAG: hypothetical protein ABIQ90_15265 [Polaromonas sp.]